MEQKPMATEEQLNRALTGLYKIKETVPNMGRMEELLIFECLLEEVIREDEEKGGG